MQGQDMVVVSGKRVEGSVCRLLPTFNIRLLAKILWPISILHQQVRRCLKLGILFIDHFYIS